VSPRPSFVLPVTAAGPATALATAVATVAAVEPAPAALGATPTAVPPAPPAPDARPEPDAHRGPELLPLDAGEQYRFGFDMGACIGCHSCEVACAEQNGLPAGTVWRRVGEIEGGDHPDTRRWHMSMACNHCVEPACLEGCPTNAYEKLANGIVAHHADDCVGCQYCVWTCPYSVPAFQPDRRIVTKCDMCQPRLEEGYAPACVSACPTHAITVEKVNVDAWRADHAAGDAPHLPDAGITLSTTRITLPPELAGTGKGTGQGRADGTGRRAGRGAAALPVEPAGDWALHPEDPHWPLVWLTLTSQMALGASATAVASGSTAARALAAVLSVAAMAGATFHLGRPAAAWKAMRNLRTSWLSREVALLSLYALVAIGAVAVPALALPAAAVGVAGVFASARLYLVPGRPAWDSRLTIVRFLATAVALGPAVTGYPTLAAAGATLALLATALNWWRLARGPAERAWRGPLRLELGTLRPATVARVSVTVAGVVAALAGAPVALVAVLLTAAELVGRWLFYVTVVPLDVPGSFWRGTGAHR
jgi:Fe-S-cluster-containing dehydrogenase component/DMSO reductase anchor subunit